MWTLFQFGLACAFGGWAYLALADDPNPKVALFGALLAGFGGSWGVMFALTWARFGWRAACSLRMDQRDAAERDMERWPLRPFDKRLRGQRLTGQAPTSHCPPPTPQRRP